MTTDSTLHALTAPVHAWLGDLRDPWLADVVRDRVARGNLWNAVVGAALYNGRLLSGEPDERRRILQALERGRADWQVSRPRRWFATLSPEKIDQVEGLALAELDALEEGVVTLSELESKTARARALIRLCHRRDDLQAVRVLLQASRPDGIVAQALNDLDPYAEELFDEMPALEPRFDERLRRMAQFGADSWWTRPALWMRGDEKKGEGTGTGTIPNEEDKKGAGQLLRGKFGDVDLPLTDVTYFGPRRNVAGGAGDPRPGVSVLEHPADEVLVRVRVTPADELVVDVRFLDLPMANASVTLELIAAGTVLERFGPRRTNSLGQTSFGHCGQYPPPRENQTYSVHVEPFRH